MGMKRHSCHRESKCVGEVLFKSMSASFCQLACAKKSFQPWEKERGKHGAVN